MIYIHVPFCASHCTYCAFYSELLHHRCAGGSDALSAYVDAVCREIGLEAPGALVTGVQPSHRPSSPQTLYFGGGTPSLLDLGMVERILSTLHSHGLYDGGFEEFTFEVNPEDVIEKGMDYARGLHSLGVNRISMGVQSFDDEVLRRMGRRHRNEQSKKAFILLREAGFENVSIDLIFGFEKQFDVEALHCGLLELSGGSALKGKLPEHISCYQLGVEQGSGLEKMLDKGLWALPEDDACAERYMQICSLLRELGYEHYEISNWAQPGCRSRHNSGYWRHVPYLGLGPGAHSLLAGPKLKRRWNIPDLKAYLAAAASAPTDTTSSDCGNFADIRGEETLTREQIREEEIFLGLRTSSGIPDGLISEAAVERHLASGELIRDGEWIRIPEDKWFISDNIISHLI